VKTILEAVQGAAGFFDVDALALKYTALSAAAKAAKAPEDFATLAEALQALIDDLVAADRYEAADQAAALSVQVSRKSNDVSLSTRAAARSREVADAKILYQSMKGVLEAQSRNPDDPGANLEIGRFLCFVKGSWDLGLRFLVKSSDAELKELAQKEVAAPLLPSDRVALADGWFDLVEKEKSPLRKGALLTHARGIYESAQPGASTLLRAKIEKRLGDIDAAALAAGTVSGTRDRVTLDLGGGLRMELIYIKPGVFAMGGTQAPPAGDDRWADERPAHRVTLTKGYYLGKTEVTRGQFAAFVKATGYKTEAEREGKAWGRAGFLAGNNWLTPTFPQTDDHPATCISWNDAKAFCDWAAKKTGRGVRLPMEAEWEYACRAGANTRWSFGDDESAIGDYAWTDRNSGDQTHPVGQKKPNAWGLYDMHGNVWEWCLDGAGPYSGDAVDPAGPFSGVLRCRRGGSCFHPAVEGRAAFRGSSWVGLMASDTGFRAALTP
jgi:formylglycine-generating enzyme required for sulfatase activity